MPSTTHRSNARLLNTTDSIILHTSAVARRILGTTRHDRPPIYLTPSCIFRVRRAHTGQTPRSRSGESSFPSAQSTWNGVL